ncbi:PAS domain S-box protein [Planctomycetota bacterium]|nr:PAS domain S-box protein [Planctomycetota bacterium]
MTQSDDRQNLSQSVTELQEQVVLLEKSLEHYRLQEQLIPDFAEQFRSVLEYAPGVVYFCKNDPPYYSMVYMNEAVETLTGYDKSLFLEGKLTFGELIHGDDAKRVADAILKAIDERTEYRLTYRIKHKNGSWRWVQEIGQGVPDPDTFEIKYLKGAIWDITAGKVHEAQLEARDTILDAVHFAVEQFLRMGSWESRLPQVLERLGTATGVSYVFIFKNHIATEEDIAKNVHPIGDPSIEYDIEVGDLLYTQTNHWHSEFIKPENVKPVSVSIPYDKVGFTRWHEVLSKGETILSDVADLPDEEKKYLTARGIRSVHAVPIFAGGEWWGFIALDEGKRERQWSPREMDLLQSVADTLGAAIVRQSYEIKLRELNEQLERRVMARTAELERMTEQFEHQAQTLSTIMLSSPDHLWLFDPMNRIMQVSRSVLDDYGVEESFIIGKTPYEAGFTKERMGSVIAEIKQMFESGKAQFGEIDMLTTQGERRFSYILTPLREENGYIYGGLAVSRDVTERKLAEDRLRESEQRLQGILDNTPASIYLKDTKGKYLFVNRMFERRYRHTVNEIVGKTDFDLFKPHLAELYRSNDINVMSTGETVEFEEAALVNGEARINLSIKFPLYDAEDKVAGICGISADITDRINAEQVWKLVRTAIDQIDEAVIITDARVDEPGPEIIYVNPAFEHMTGWDTVDIVGQTPRVLQGPKTDRSVLDQLRNALDTGRPCTGETINYRKDGKEYTVQWHITPVRDEKGDVANFVSIQRDVSEQKQAEELERRRRDELAHVARLSTMGEMASGLAHELNQPLAAISNYVFGCRKRVEMDTIDKDSLVEALANVGSQAQRAGEIIRRMRNFVRKRESQKNYISVNEIVNDVLELCAAENRGLGITIKDQLNPEVPFIGVDAIQIEQVVLNLIRNAGEAMQETPIEDRQLTLISRISPDEPDLIELAVSDSGIGSDEDTIKQIFNPFFSTKSDGMGMGLTISQSIVENHGGKLWARPNSGGPGLTFYMTLPICDDPDEIAEDRE